MEVEAEVETRENSCNLYFVCDEDKTIKNCLYRVNKKLCKYNKEGMCFSSVATVNKLKLYLNSIGLDISPLKKINER